MAADRLTIDPVTVFDNVGEERVEFVAEADGDAQAFAVLYDTLRALSGEDPVTEPVALFQRFADRIAGAAAKALGRDEDQAIVVIDESDI